MGYRINEDGSVTKDNNVLFFINVDLLICQQMRSFVQIVVRPW